MNKPTLDSIATATATATATAKVEEELRKLEEQDNQLRQQQAADAFAEVMNLLGKYGQHFSAKQKAELVTAAGANSPICVKAPAATEKKEVAPKYWLPHSGEIWAGRGRTPRAFITWEGTAAYREWKEKRPDEKFPG